MKNTSLTVMPGILICIAVLMPTSAYAYLDPGAGTFALQGLIAIVAGGMVALRAYWHRLRDLFRGSKTSADMIAERSSPDGDA
jgi:hypothetical protein